MPAEHGADERAAAPDRPHAAGLPALDNTRARLREAFNHAQA